MVEEKAIRLEKAMVLRKIMVPRKVVLMKRMMVMAMVMVMVMVMIFEKAIMLGKMRLEWLYKNTLVVYLCNRTLPQTISQEIGLRHRGVQEVDRFEGRRS